MDALARFLQTPGAAARLARDLGEFPQNITNWQRRGVPLAKAARVAAVTGIPVEQLPTTKRATKWHRDAEGRVTGYTVSTDS